MYNLDNISQNYFNESELITKEEKYKEEIC